MARLSIYIVVWHAFLIAWLLLLMQITSPATMPLVASLTVLLLAGAGVGLSSLMRRDRYRASQFGLVISVGFIVLGAVITFDASTVSVSSIGVAACSSISAATFLYFWIRTLKTPDNIPDLLLARFDRTDIRESNDVQWCRLQSNDAIDTATTVELIFQNCVDASRTVRLRLVERGSSPNAEKKLTFPEQIAAVLGPCEVARVTIPIRRYRNASGSAELEIFVESIGVLGKRVRRLFRATPVVTPFTVLFRVVSFLSAGRFKWRGGSVVRFDIRAQANSDRFTSVPLNEWWQTLWLSNGGAQVALDKRRTLRPNGPTYGSGRAPLNSSSPNPARSSTPFSSSSQSVLPQNVHVPPLRVPSFDRTLQSAPELSTPPLSLAQGKSVRVHRGKSVFPATVIELDQRRVRCEFDDGRRAWIMVDQIEC